jgi:hypothetical protein
MSNDKNSNSSSHPASKMRLAEKMKKLKNGITLHTYTEHTEDKGSDTVITEAEHGGNVVARFVQKDGETIESHGSDDAQQSGAFDDIAKKVGAQDSITHTKAEQVSEIAHDNMPDSETKNHKAKKPEEKTKMDNSHEAQKGDFVNKKTPKEPEKIEKSGIHYGSSDNSISYQKGGAPKMAKAETDEKPAERTLNYKKINGVKEGQSKTLDYKEINKKPNQKKEDKGMLVIDGDKEYIHKADPLKKKWQVFMESCTGFDDPLRKEPLDKADVPAFGFDEKKDEEKKDDANTLDYKKINKIKQDKEERSLNYKEINAIKTKTGPSLDYSAPQKEQQEPPTLDYAHMGDNPAMEDLMDRTDMTADDAEVRPGSRERIKQKIEKWKKFVAYIRGIDKTVRKSDVIDFKKKKEEAEFTGALERENAASKMRKISDAAKRFSDEYDKRKGKVSQDFEKDSDGVPHAFWRAYRSQKRKEDAKQIPSPVDEKPQATVTPIKKPTVEIRPEPSEDINADPEIIANLKARLAEDKTKKSQTLAKASPKILKRLLPQHLPSAEGGLENHLQNLQTALSKNETKLVEAQDKSKYEKDISKESRDKNIKMAERTHKYLTMGIDLIKKAIAARDSATPRWSDLLGVGNPKVNQMGIITFGNTLPGHHCPARGGCGDGSCYGMNGQQAMGNALDLRARNSGLVHRPDFVQGAIQAIKNAPKHMIIKTGEDMYEAIKDHPRFKEVLLSTPQKMPDGTVKFKVKSGDVFRWHDTGDILNEKHLDDIVKIAQAFPDKKFYMYTKSLHLPLEKLRAQPNVNVVQSLGGKHNDKVDMSKPHAKFFNSLDEAHAAGYSPVWFHDWPATDGTVKIALVPHGSRKKEIDVNQYNNEQNDIPSVDLSQNKIKKSLAPSHEPDWMTFDQPDALAQSAAMGLKGKFAAIRMLHHNHDVGVPVAVIQKSEDLKKDVVSIKTGKQVRATKKRIEAQPEAPNSGFPTPSPVKDVNGKAEYAEVSDNVANKFKKIKNAASVDRSKMSTDEKIKAAMESHGQFKGQQFNRGEVVGKKGDAPMVTGEHMERTKRIKASLEAINRILGDQRNNGDQQKPKLSVVKEEGDK